MVDSAIPSLVDNKVRRVIIKYKNKGEKGYRISERPASKCILVVPIENQQHTWIYDDIDNEPNDNVPDSLEPEPSELQEPLGQEPDRPAVIAESEPAELQELPEPIPIEDRNQHQKTGMALVPAQGVGVEWQQSTKLAEPLPTCESAGITSHSEGAPVPPSRQEPPSWISRLRAGSSRKIPSRYND